jgi:hypothetical protein
MEDQQEWNPGRDFFIEYAPRIINAVCDPNETRGLTAALLVLNEIAKTRFVCIPRVRVEGKLI